MRRYGISYSDLGKASICETEVTFLKPATRLNEPCLRLKISSAFYGSSKHHS